MDIVNVTVTVISLFVFCLSLYRRTACSEENRRFIWFVLMMSTIPVTSHGINFFYGDPVSYFVTYGLLYIALVHTTWLLIRTYLRLKKEKEAE
jgi:hypothetical protein